MDITHLTPEGFPQHQTDTIGYVSADGKTLFLDVPEYHIMVTAESDLALLPDTLPPGTHAFTADGTSEWRKKADGDWATVKEPAQNSEE